MTPPIARRIHLRLVFGSAFASPPQEPILATFDANFCGAFLPVDNRVACFVHTMMIVPGLGQRSIIVIETLSS